MNKQQKLFWILFIPFLLNDFLLIAFQKSFYTVLIIDYSFRIFILWQFFRALKRGHIAREDAFLSDHLSSTSLLTILFLGLFQLGLNTVLVFFTKFAPDIGLFDFPRASSTFMAFFDLTVGLSLVAISEEVVFRGFILKSFLNRGFDKHSAVLLQAILFGITHWSMGDIHVIRSFIWAIPLGYFVAEEKKLFPAIGAHFLTNLVVFWRFYF